MAKLVDDIGVNFVIFELDKCAKDEYGEPLPCYGCAHSASNLGGKSPFPGKPSGERPCGFCIRNIHLKNRYPEQPKWYDGSTPVKIPMDCYHTCDIKEQMDVWDENLKARVTKETEDRILKGRRRIKV